VAAYRLEIQWDGAWNPQTDEEGQGMQRIFLRAKIHRVRVTETRLNYEGSLSIDSELMAQVDIAPNEQVGVYNLANGERFDTYAIAAPEGSGEVSLNGAAARKGQAGDLIIITTYVLLDEEELTHHQPKVLMVDKNNRPLPTGSND